MTKLIPIAIAIAAFACATAASAEPIQINDDENYSRLASWEQHLDQRISDGVNRGSLGARDALRFQKRLDGIEIHLLQAYYASDNGLENNTANNYAQQLRSLGRDLGENDWSGYNGGFGDNGDHSDHGYNRTPNYGPAPQASNDDYYREGQYETRCHSGNQAGGTIFGAIAGGLVGGAVSHGNGGAVVGGVILGGMAGNALSKDIDCDDQRYAYTTYDEGLNGPVGHEVDWHHNDRSGTFTTTREYRQGNYICRDFHAVNYRDGRPVERDGTACREDDGHWHFR